jgi:hypothetical protein
MRIHWRRNVFPEPLSRNGLHNTLSWESTAPARGVVSWSLPSNRSTNYNISGMLRTPLPLPPLPRWAQIFLHAWPTLMSCRRLQQIHPKRRYTITFMSLHCRSQRVTPESFRMQFFSSDQLCCFDNCPIRSSLTSGLLVRNTATSSGTVVADAF